MLDAPMISSIATLALDTDLGALNLWTRCHVIGDHQGALNKVLDSGRTGFPFPVLGPQTWMAMERGNGRAMDKDRLFEPRQVEIEHQRAARLERYRRSILSSSASTLA